MQVEVTLLRDARGYRRARSTMPGYHAGRRSARKGQTYPPTAPTAAEVFAMLDACGDELVWRRQRALMALLWRTGMRISEACALVLEDLHPETHTVTVRRGKGGKHRTVPLDDWGWEELEMWLRRRADLPRGPIFCVVKGPTRGVRSMDKREATKYVSKAARLAGLTRRFVAHSFRHAFTLGVIDDGGTLNDVMVLLGHSNLAVTGIYFRSISGASVAEKIGTSRPRPMVPMPH